VDCLPLGAPRALSMDSQNIRYHGAPSIYCDDTIVDYPSHSMLYSQQQTEDLFDVNGSSDCRPYTDMQWTCVGGVHRCIIFSESSQIAVWRQRRDWSGESPVTVIFG